MKLVRGSWLLGAVCALMMIVGAGQAAAATVTVSPTGAKTLTTTSGAKLTVISSSGTRTVTMTTCTIRGTWSNASGAFPLFFSPPTVAVTPLDNTRGNMTFACSGCSLASVVCTFVCDGQMNIAAVSATSGGMTPVRLTGIHCTITFGSTGCTATVAGTTAPNDGGVNGLYDNATNLLTINATGQNLAVVSSTCVGLLPTGSATITGPTGTNLVFLTSPSTTVTAV